MSDTPVKVTLEKGGVRVSILVEGVSTSDDLYRVKDMLLASVPRALLWCQERRREQELGTDLYLKILAKKKDEEPVQGTLWPAC